MSYCRWSSDDFKSDVYVYANVSGKWTIHVAGNRHVPFDTPSPGPLPHPDDGEDAFKTWAEKNAAFMEALQAAGREYIDLPHAGETFDLDSPGEAAAQLEELRTLGYHVPDGVIESLREEEELP